MAGFLFGLDSLEALSNCINRGVYSTRLSIPNGYWKPHHEGTFADYSSMKKGDNVYFFIKRKIYGIGTLTNLGGDCKFLNYPDANSPTNQNYRRIRNTLLLDLGSSESLKFRFICTFIPSPLFFKNGIDMDEVLSSSPTSFKILRAFWKVSFIKFSDDENQAFKNILLRRNIATINQRQEQDIFPSNFERYHKEISRKVRGNRSYRLSIGPFLNTISNTDGSIRHEMAIEAGLIHLLSSNNRDTIKIFGNWDYLSHQVIASPFKPIDYIDKIDVFGYRFIPDQKPMISNYLVIEIKRGVINTQDILQLMKYVDWVKNDYSFGDYSMINAFMVGYGYTREALHTFREIVERKFVQGVRPSVAAEWKDVKLVTYRFNEYSDLLNFEVVANANQ